MGFPNIFGGGKKNKDNKDDETLEAAGSGQPKTGFSIKPESSPPPSQEAFSNQTRASSVFEFGAIVTVGQDYMRGVCIGEDPDAIQACTWSIEPAQGKPKDKHHLYRIEF